MNFIGIKDLNHLIRVASISDEMRDFFNKRTKEHIDRVKKYCKKIYDYDNNRFKELIDRSKEHDASKLENPEMDPYIYITWDYKCKRDGKPFDIPEDIKKEMNEATNHHIKYNRYHPEYHCDSKDKNMINRENRDAIPDKIIDATKNDGSLIKNKKI